MYDLLYVRKRRRRKIAALVSSFSAIGVTALVIIAFLGRTVGTFTVSVANSTVKLALSEKQEYKNSTTSYLRIDELPSTYFEYSYDWFDNLDLVDSEKNDYYYGAYRESGQVVGMYYLKYTFYVINVGTKLAQYTMNINLDECTQSEDNTSRTLDETLRVMVFENDPLAEEENHDYEVYAKDIVDSRYKTYDKDGNQTFREFISNYPYAKNDGGLYEDDAHPLAKSFIRTGKTIIKKNVTNFRKGDMRRYTLVYWLEGSDPQANIDGQDAPQGAKIKLSVDINATSYSA